MRDEGLKVVANIVERLRQELDEAHDEGTRLRAALADKEAEAAQWPEYLAVVRERNAASAELAVWRKSAEIWEQNYMAEAHLHDECIAELAAALAEREDERRRWSAAFEEARVRQNQTNADLDATLRVLDAARAELAAALGERERYRAALGKYGRHDTFCSVVYMVYEKNPPCSCGFAAALALPPPTGEAAW